jgi:hypothetical protein
MKLLFSKQNYNVLPPSSYTHISVRDLYISRIGPPILLQENMLTDIKRSQTHNVEIRTEAAQFPEKEYIRCSVGKTHTVRENKLGKDNV